MMLGLGKTLQKAQRKNSSATGGVSGGLRSWALAASVLFVLITAQAQPAPGQGKLFVTQVAPGPDGALLSPLDLGLGLYTTILHELSFPESVVCHKGRLYLTETFAEQSVGAAADIIIHGPQRIVEASERTFHRVLRAEQDGSGKRFIVEWDSKVVLPSTLALGANGDLFIGTTSEDGQLTQGVWRIASADNTNRGFNPPQLVLPPELFLPPDNSTSYSVRPAAFLTSGPYAGDLLVIDAPVQAFVEGGRVLRAVGPGYNRVEPFIAPFNDPQTERPFKPAGLAITPDGAVLVTDFANDKILRYSSDGSPDGMFVERLKSPNQIAVGADGVVYVTNTEFRGQNVTGGLFVYDAAGELITTETSPIFLRGIAICG